METRANYLLIGGFVLATLAALIAFVIWMAKVEIEGEFTQYAVYFEGSVSGLSTAGDVRFKGIPVGAVKEISIDPINPERIRVIIEVDSSTPVKEDTVAQLELQGITGVSYVQLTGGSMDSPRLQRRGDQVLPTITSKPSQFEELFAGAPELINRLMILIGEATKIFNKQNRRAMSDTLQNLAVLSSSLAARTYEIDQIIANLSDTSQEMRLASRQFNIAIESGFSDFERITDSADATMLAVRGVATSADEIVKNDLRSLFNELRRTNKAFGDLGDELNAVMIDNRDTVTDFLGEGLYEFSRLVTEMRLMVGNLTRVTNRIESDPAKFIFGDSSQGFEAE